MLALFCGCLGATNRPTATSPAKPPPVSTVSSTVSLPSTTYTTSTTSTIPVNATQVCVEARANLTIYQTCRKTSAGQVYLPPQELQRCAQIQEHAGEYARNLYHGLTYCVGIPTGIKAPDNGPSFCKDLQDQEQDNCYLLVRQCSKIREKTLREKCLSGS